MKSEKNMVNQLRDYLSSPVDIASAAFVRVVFGLIMLWEVVRYFDNGWIERYWLEPTFHFHYFGFGFVSPWPGNGMYWHFVFMGLLALMIAFGLFYRIASILFFFAFSYVFLLEQARYLNHFYLVCLVSGLLMLMPVHRSLSLDARWGLCKRSEFMPMWCLWLLRFQVGAVYFFGGIAKLNGDWLRGEPLATWLVNRSDFPLVGPLLENLWVGVGMAYGGLLFDLFIVPLLLWPRTRALAFVGVLFFNFSNAILFTIGIFPWFAIGLSTLFFHPSWPRRFLIWRTGSLAEKEDLKSFWRRHSALTLSLVALYVSWQLFLPFRHWLYPGRVSWTEEGHQYAWHMKLRSKSTRFRMYVTNNENGKRTRVKMEDYLESWQASKMSGRPDMIIQFVHYLGNLLKEEGMTDISIHVDAQVSLNGRNRYPLVDSSVNLLNEPRSIWPKSWLLPMPDEPVRSPD